MEKGNISGAVGYIRHMMQSCAVSRVNGAMLIDLAQQRFGKPSRKIVTDYRFFDNLKLLINPQKRTFSDFATGESGGVLDFIIYLGLATDRRSAAQWIEEQFACVNHD